MKIIQPHEPLSLSEAPAALSPTADGLTPATLQEAAANIAQVFTYRLASATELRVALGGLQALFG